MALVNTAKNRDRDAYSFANINLLGRCNARCFFCLGLDIKEELGYSNQLATHFSEWANFHTFLELCRTAHIKNLYVTGQNTDSLLYHHLEELIRFLQRHGFAVGLRTNGYRALAMLDVINLCDRNVGYSIHSLRPITNRMIMGRAALPDWGTIIPATNRCRVSIVLNRCNKAEFFDLLRYITQFENVQYVQVRRVSTDRREDELAPDMVAYEEVYSVVRGIFPLERRFATDAEAYNIYGKEVVFWRTTKTSVNSMNYFTDGTISPEYFIVEGYLKHQGSRPGGLGQRHERSNLTIEAANGGQP